MQKKSIPRYGLGLIIYILLIISCAKKAQPDEALLSTLWMRASGEYDASVIQAYQNAREMLPLALKNPTWSAAIEQANRPADLAPAIIIDIDQTILDNSPVKVQMIRRNVDFDPQLWHEWLMSGKTPVLPGALDFIRFAREQGVVVFYVTNRLETYREATIQNLTYHGFPLDSTTALLLTQDKTRGWDHDKSSRREFIATSHRILLLLGDDLNDFLPASVSPEERVRLVRQYADYWGRQWIIFPNPLYGSWEQSLYLFNAELSDEQKREAKNNYLNVSF